MSPPRHRADCQPGGAHAARPCPHVECRHRLAVEWSATTTDHATCSLDLADEGPLGLEAIGAILGVSKERVRQIEEIALGRLLMRAGGLVGVTAGRVACKSHRDRGVVPGCRYCAAATIRAWTRFRARERMCRP